MKKTIVTLFLFVMSVPFIATATAEMKNTADENSLAPFSAIRHHGPGPGEIPEMAHGPGLIPGIGGITLQKLIALDLTDGQKKAVANILADHRDNCREMIDQMKNARKAFLDTIHSEETPDEAAVRKSFKQMSSVTENLIVRKLAIMSALKQVLTTKQFDSISAHQRGKSGDRGHSRKKMGNRMKTHQEMMDTWINTYADTNKSFPNPNDGDARY